MMSRAVLLAAVLVPLAEAAFYLPGVAPKSYKTRDQVPLFGEKTAPQPAPRRGHAAEPSDVSGHAARDR